MGDALVVVDIQNDFCAGGSLAVPDGDAVVPVMNGYLKQAEAAGAPVFISRDWHPPVTSHFAPYGGTWPPHCIQGTPGAELHPGRGAVGGQRPDSRASAGRGDARVLARDGAGAAGRARRALPG